MALKTGADLKCSRLRRKFFCIIVSNLSTSSMKRMQGIVRLHLVLASFHRTMTFTGIIAYPVPFLQEIPAAILAKLSAGWGPRHLVISGDSTDP